MLLQNYNWRINIKINIIYIYRLTVSGLIELILLDPYTNIFFVISHLYKILLKSFIELKYAFLFILLLHMNFNHFYLVYAYLSNIDLLKTLFLQKVNY